MYTASFQVIPIFCEGEELSELIDKVVEVIKESKLRYEVNAHSTVVEGEKEELLKLLERIIDTCESNSRRCVVSFQIDIKSGGVRIDEKTAKYKMGS